MMFGILDYLKIGGGFVLGVALTWAVAYPLAYHRGDSAGYARYEAKQAAADKKAELERKGDDAKLQGMSDYDLCVAGLRDQRMPIDACDQLRGLRQE